MKATHAHILFTSAAFAAGFALAACDEAGAEGDVELDGGKLVAETTVTVPLLPVDLPIYPTDLTLEGLSASVKKEVDKLLKEIPEFLRPKISQKQIDKIVADLEKKLETASFQVLQPGALKAPTENQFTEILNQHVEVTKVGVQFEIANDTGGLVPVPVEFKLYIGDGAKLPDDPAQWDETLLIPFADPRVENGQFLIKPKETFDLNIENVPHLVDALNNLSGGEGSGTIGIAYKALYRMADFGNGASFDREWDVFGECMIGLYEKAEDVDLGIGDTKKCPTPEKLIGWHLTIKKFNVVITAKAEIEIPEIPGCKDLAGELKLDYLAQACP